MRFASLGSGSRGNATLIEGGGVRLLVDCGFPLRELERRLGLLGVDPLSLEALLITHEHTDHIRGLSVFIRRYPIPVWLTSGTLRGLGSHLPGTRIFSPHGPELRFGNLQVLPFPVPHDAREPVQFRFREGRDSFGLLTDTGMVTPHAAGLLQDCEALLLEANHDLQKLKTGPYPPSLQARVAGGYGHLSNRQAAELVRSLDPHRLRRLVLGHLSEKNNTPECAIQTMLEPMPWLGDRLKVIAQDKISGWIEV